MKRIISIALVLLMAISFVSCTGNSDADVSSSSSTVSVEIIDIEKYASKGEIYGCEYALGTSPDKIKEDYHYGDDEYWGEGDTVSSRYNIDAVPLDVREKDDGEVRLSTGDAKFYYYSADADKGISFIAQLHDAYGLKVGIADTDTVKTAVTATPTYDGFAESEDLFIFFDSPEGVYLLKYEFSNYELSFYFVNGKLSATCISDTNVWNK